jgi:tetratricopeptide (TPR) repeat protein
MRLSRVLVIATFVVSICFGGAPQAKSREELDAFGLALEPADPLARIKACESFITRYPGSEFHDQVLEIEFEAFEQRGDRAAVRRIGRRILQTAPGNARILAELARVELPQDPGLAEQHASQALAAIATLHRPDDLSRTGWISWKQNASASAHATLGILALQRARYPEAVTHFAESVKLRPESSEWQHDLGLALFQTKQFGRAAAAFRRAHEIRPDMPGPALFLGIAEFRLGRFADAAKNLREAIAIEPGQREGWLHLLRANQALGEFDEPLVRRAALAFPADPEIQFAIAQAALDRIREIARRANELGPESPEFLYLAARKKGSEIKSGPPSSVASYDRLAALVDNCFEAVLRSSPDSASAHIAKGYLAESRNDVGTALQEYRAGGDHFAAGRLLAQNVRLPEAEIEFRAELEANPANHLAMADLADVYTQQSETDKAKPLLDRLLTLYPQDASAWMDLGKLQQKQEDWTASAVSFQKALSLDPSLRQARYRLALTYRKLGNTEKAAAELEAFRKAQKN